MVEGRSSRKKFIIDFLIFGNGHVFHHLPTTVPSMDEQLSEMKKAEPLLTLPFISRLTPFKKNIRACRLVRRRHLYRKTGNAGHRGKVVYRSSSNGTFRIRHAPTPRCPLRRRVRRLWYAKEEWFAASRFCLWQIQSSLSGHRASPCTGDRNRNPWTERNCGCHTHGSSHRYIGVGRPACIPGT